MTIRERVRAAQAEYKRARRNRWDQPEDYRRARAERVRIFERAIALGITYRELAGAAGVRPSEVHRLAPGAASLRPPAPTLNDAWEETDG